MNEQMNKWTNEWTDEQMNKWMNRWSNQLVNQQNSSSHWIDRRRMVGMATNILPGEATREGGHTGDETIREAGGFAQAPWTKSQGDENSDVVGYVVSLM